MLTIYPFSILSLKNRNYMKIILIKHQIIGLVKREKSTILYGISFNFFDFIIVENNERANQFKKKKKIIVVLLLLTK